MNYSLIENIFPKKLLSHEYQLVRRQFDWKFNLVKQFDVTLL